MNEIIREEFLKEWVLKATTNEIVEKLIQNDERAKELQRKDNIINELKKWLIVEINRLHNISGDNFTTVGQFVYQEVLNKIKELEKEGE